MITDLGNDLLSCDYWDSNELHSPHIKKLKETSFLYESMPFVTALAADVVFHPDKCGRSDTQIDEKSLLVF